MLDATPVVASPIIMFFAAEQMAQALVLSTYRAALAKGHGLEWVRDDDRDAVRIKRAGLFQQFHDSHSNNTAVYIDEPLFALVDLFSINIDLMDEFHMAIHRVPAVSTPDLVDWDLELSSPQSDPLVYEGRPYNLMGHDYRLLTLFILASKARYQPWVWLDYLDSAEGFVAKAFLESTKRRLPNLFLNELLGQEIVFDQGRSEFSTDDWKHFDLDE